MTEKPSLTRICAAWMAHLLTASGAFLGFLAFLAYFSEDFRRGTLYIILAVFIDAIDGFFARRARVKEVLPQFDGTLMDNLIDFNTYTMIPLIMLWQARLVEGSWALTTVTLILVASIYQFCRGEAKTDDHFFLGFPSYWNIVIIYLYWLGSSSMTNVSVLLFFVFLSFIPLKFLYPTRSHHFRWTSIIVSSLGGFTFLYISLLRWDQPPSLSLIAIPTLFMIYVILSLVAHKRSLTKHD